jgi:hypothetical protein
VGEQFLQSAIYRKCPEELERLEEKLAEVQEATEQRMHSVADLVPEKSEEIHQRADRLSESAEEHRRRVQRRRADDDGRDGCRPGSSEDLPQIFLSSAKSLPRPGLLTKTARQWILGPRAGGGSS